MKITFEIDGKKYSSDTKKYIDISLIQDFSDHQANSFGVRKAIANPYKIGDFEGDTNKGSSCNFDELTVTPHCNGTHTECIGHILNTRDTITDNLDDVIVPAYLISCNIINGTETADKYIPKLDDDDLIISYDELKGKIENLNLENKALIIRTLPNELSKRTQDYNKIENIFFTNDAMKYMVEKGVKHLLVDQSSIDKAHDDGKLSNHRIFWDVELDKKSKEKSKEYSKTITEFVFIPDNINDGLYLLNIQIASFALDASPSRPILFNLFEI
jgi:kynurenine formamidase